MSKEIYFITEKGAQRLYTAQEVAKELQVTYAYIRRLKSRSELHKLGIKQYRENPALFFLEKSQKS